MNLLILSRSESVHADVVAEHCGQYATVNRVNFDFDTPSIMELPCVILGSKPLNYQPDAVFVHHPRVSYSQQGFVDDIERKLFVASWDSVKEWMEVTFPDALWVNRPSANHKSKNVLGQLRLATSLGIKTPDTLFTNNIEKLRQFATGKTVVIKQGNLGVHLEKKRILTQVIDVASIDSNVLQGCPCLFQKYIEKRYELRIHVIGQTVLACKIDSQASSKTRIDWRNYDLQNTPHEPYKIDSSLGNVCADIVRQLGLEFGIIDMIVTPENEYIFLECNAQGHWAWIEELTGLPITKTLCDHLLRGSTLC